jgi:hypothetical protein
MRQEQRERGGAQHAAGVDRDDPVGQRLQIADVLAGDVVGGVALLAVAGLVDTEDEGRLAQCVPQQPQAALAEGFHRPLGIGQEMVERLRVQVDSLAQPRERFAPRLGQQAQVQGGELLKVPHVMEQVAIPRALLVDEAHRRGGRACLAHGDASFGRPILHTPCLR